MAAAKMVASADDPTPTVLGILVMGKNPQDFLPGAYVQFLKFDGTEPVADIVDDEDIRGSVPDVLRRLDEKLKAHNRTAVDFVSAPLEKRTSLYPIPAIQQFTRNAVMHRAYEATNAPVHVHWFEDRIEINSPGGPYGKVTADNFGSAGAVDYRNPNLADAMKTLGFVQRFGPGYTHGAASAEGSRSSRSELRRRPERRARNHKSGPTGTGRPEMTVPVLTFFNNKGGVGKTSLVYHLAWMYADLGLSVVAADLDPQANLTSMFLGEDRFEDIWSDTGTRRTVYGALQPLMEGTGDIASPELETPGEGLSLIVGDLRLSLAEDELSSQWPGCLDRQPRAFRVISALWRILQAAAEKSEAELVLVDVGPEPRSIEQGGTGRLRSRSRAPRGGSVLSPGPPKPWPYTAGLARRMAGPPHTHARAEYRPSSWGHASRRLRGAAAQRPPGPSGKGIRQVGQPNARRVRRKPAGRQRGALSALA